MAKENSTLGLCPNGLARLLGIVADAGGGDECSDADQEKAELLRERLASRLPLDLWTDRDLPKHLRPFGKSVECAMSRPLNELVLDDRAGLDLLVQVKNHGALLSRSATSQAEHHTANVIYYAALANALLSYGRKLTAFSYPKLIESFQALAQCCWVTPELSRNFRKAAKLCTDHRDSVRGPEAVE